MHGNEIFGYFKICREVGIFVTEINFVHSTHLKCKDSKHVETKTQNEARYGLGIKLNVH